MPIRHFVGSLLFIFIIVDCSFSQSIVREWKIDRLILNETQNEYKLTSVNENPEGRFSYDYGNHLRFKEDGTFQSWYTAPCGNDCFTTSSGIYNWVDDTHIELTLDTITYSWFCSTKESQLDFPFRVGTFYIHSDSAGCRLIKSTSRMKDDENNLLYSNYIDSLSVYYQQFTNLDKGVKPDTVLPFTEEGIMNFYLSSVGRDKSEGKLLYWKQLGYSGKVVLIELDDEYKLISASSTGSSDDRTIYEIVTFDMSFIHQTIGQADFIDARKRRFKTERTRENKVSYHELTKVHSVKGEVVKVVLDRVFGEGTVRIIYYLNDGNVFYIKQISDLIRNGQERKTSCELFVKNPGEIVRRELSETGSWVDCDSYHGCLKRLKKIIKI
jgi:hypothetical protein